MASQTTSTPQTPLTAPVTGAAQASGAESKGAPIVVRVAIPPASITEDDALIARLADLINAVYTAAEAGLVTTDYHRTDPAEARELIRRGELALAWRGGEEEEEGSGDAPAAAGVNGPTATSIPTAATLLGCVRIQQLSATHGDFGLLACDSAYQGTGAGRKLVQFAEERCRALGRTVMQCELLVPADAGAQIPSKARVKAWYERMGYSVVRAGDFGADYPALKRFLLDETRYIVFEKPLE